jgi:hypothetical protein
VDVLRGYVSKYLSGPDAAILGQAIRYMWDSRPVQAVETLLTIASDSVVNHGTCDGILKEGRRIWNDPGSVNNFTTVEDKIDYKIKLLQKLFAQNTACTEGNDPNSAARHDLAIQLLHICLS